MAFGTLGSTLNDELNRLANGGTYRDMDDMVDEALAAKQWANRENIVPYSTDTVGILNEIAALGPNRQNWYDFNGVCNYLAGTTGLPAAAALRQITTTGDILTSLAAFYTDAATPTNWGSLGYVYLPGVFNNYLSVPDAASLDVTGDIDLRVQIAMDDWTPSASQRVLVKGATNQQSYELTLSHSPAGFLNFRWSTDGVTLNTAASNTTAVPFADGTAGWIRATRVASTGVTKFYTSTDGTTWTQLGTDVSTTAGNIFSGTGTVVIGQNWDGGNPTAGKLYRAQVLNGIDGTTVLDVNIATDFKATNYDAFTATTGQTVSVIGLNTLANLGKAGSLLPITVGSSTAADSNDAKFLDHTGTNYVYLPGVLVNYLSIPDSAALDITGDIDIRAQVALDDWTPAATQNILVKESSSTTRSYRFFVTTDGRLNLSVSADGSTIKLFTSSVAPTVTDGSVLWVRGVLDVDNGSGNTDGYFYTSTNGTSWTQLGTTQTAAGTSSIFNSTSPVEIGSRWSGTLEALAGKVYRAQIFNGIDGTKVLDVDTSVITSGADTYVVPTTYTGQAGAYFTGSGLSLNGVAGNYVSTPDSTPLDITGDLDLQVKVAMTDWTPGNSSVLLDKWGAAGQRSYSFYLLTTGLLYLSWTADGTTEIAKASTVATGITDGSTKWVRVTLDVNNGASGNDVKFWTSDDGTTWTQLGSTVTTAGTTSIFNSTTEVKIGQGLNSTAFNANGTFYEAIVKSGIDGYTVFDADFTQVSANALRMTESSINKAVVTLNTTRYATINRSTSGRKTVAVTQPTWLFGTDDYMEVNNRYMDHTTSSENYVYLSGASGNYMSTADSPPLDVTGDIDIRVKVALDDWTPSAENTLLGKYNPSTSERSYNLSVTTGGNLALLWSVNGVTLSGSTSTVATGLTDGATKWVRVTLDVDNGAGGNDTKFFLSDDGVTWTQLGTTLTNSGTTSIFASTQIVEIGSRATGTATPAKGKFYRAIIKNGIDGTTVLDANAAVITLPSQTTFTDSSSNAYTVTINKSGVGTFVSTGNYMYLPGIAGNWATSPDSAALDITGDIDIRVKVAMDDWTPSSDSGLLAKSDIGADAYLFYIVAGVLQLFWVQADGSSKTASSGGITIPDGATKWVRVTLDVDNGASGYTATFYTSDDGITWTTLGSPVVVAGVTNIRATAAQLNIGNQRTSSKLSRGKFFRAQVLNGIGGTVAFDANFENSITSLNQASFTESSSNAATVTINRSGSAYRSAGVIDAGYLYPGATNTFANSTIDYLNFGASDSFSVLAVVRQWNTPVNGGLYISKRDAGSVNVGYEMYPTTSNTQFLALDDGPTGPFSSFTNATIGSILTDVGIVNRSTQTTTFYTNAATNTASASISTLGSLSNIGALSIGRRPAGSGGSGGLYQDFEFIGAAVFRSVLTPAQIRQISNYFANREAYL